MRELYGRSLARYIIKSTGFVAPVFPFFTK